MFANWADLQQYALSRGWLINWSTVGDDYVEIVIKDKEDEPCHCCGHVNRGFVFGIGIGSSTEEAKQDLINKFNTPFTR